jgi:inosine-uridine nucleoside N-ribohydrolase
MFNPFSGNSAQPVKIIFDTDMGPDYDDVGAIAVLHALAANGECKILACCASDGHPTIAPTIDAFNRYFSRADIPVGTAGKEAPDFTAKNHWNDSIVAMCFKENKTNADYPSAVEVYRKTLAGQKNKSVTIVTVGFISNMADLLKSGPDNFSPLTGMELVKKKVKNWVAMAGRFPEGGEFNVNKHPEASYYVFQNWPTPILFSGWEIGASIFTGRKLANEGSADNPLSWAYRYNLDTYSAKEADKRQSWDQTAVLCAVRKPEKYFYVNGPGKFVIFEDGNNTWDPDTNAKHYFLVHKYPYQKIADVIDELMLYEP